MRSARIRRVAVVLLALLIALVLSGAFVASWPSLMSAAAGVHLSGWGQVGYSVVPDASAALSVVALLVLRSDIKARRLAFVNLALMTGASVVLNLAHGLDWWRSPETWLLAVASVVPVASILISTDILVRAFVVLAPALESEEQGDETEAPTVMQPEPAVMQSTPTMTREEFEALLIEQAEEDAAETAEEEPTPLHPVTEPGQRTRTGRGHFV